MERANVPLKAGLSQIRIPPGMPIESSQAASLASGAKPGALADTPPAVFT